MRSGGENASGGAGRRSGGSRGAGVFRYEWGDTKKQFGKFGPVVRMALKVGLWA
jgi:hypothetical protein